MTEVTYCAYHPNRRDRPCAAAVAEARLHAVRCACPHGYHLQGVFRSQRKPSRPPKP